MSLLHVPWELCWICHPTFTTWRAVVFPSCSLLFRLLINISWAGCPFNSVLSPLSVSGLSITGLLGFVSEECHLAVSHCLQAHHLPPGVLPRHTHTLILANTDFHKLKLRNKLSIYCTKPTKLVFKGLATQTESNYTTSLKSVSIWKELKRWNRDWHHFSLTVWITTSSWSGSDEPHQQLPG